MYDDKKENEFTEKENKAITAGSYLISFFALFQGFFCLFHNSHVNVGKHVLYIFSGITVAMIIISIVYFILFFKILRKIKKYCFRYSIILLLVIVMISGIIYIGSDYVIDIFAGTKTITTNEYIMPLKKNTYIRFIDADGNKVGIFLSKEIAEELETNPVFEDNSWSENNLLYHENTITIEYYPNSKVLLEVNIN